MPSKKKSITREEYLAICEKVFRGGKVKKQNSKGKIVNVDIDMNTRLRYGKEIAKLRGWYDEEPIGDEDGEKSVVLYIPDNGKVSA